MIEQLVNEINGLLRDGYPYSALGIALTLPDICGNIAYPNTKVADHYKKWYSEYVNPISALKFKDGFDEEICYKLRCAYLHSGNFDLGNADAVKNIKNLLLTARLILSILVRCSFICCSHLFVQVGKH